jgi:cytochrome c-type biogenesis protein
MNQGISLTTAFGAGFLSFFAPCILPLIPPYFAWILGISQEELQKDRKVRLDLFVHTLFLVLGFSIIFIILGASASRLGQMLLPHRLLVQRVGGLMIIFFGLNFIGFFKMFNKQSVQFIKKLIAKIDHKSSSFLVGSIFAFAWIACFSPILGSILVLSSFQQTLTSGVTLLSFYSLGLATPFLLSSLFLNSLIGKMNYLTRFTKPINLFSGLILVVLGALLLSDNYYKVVALLNRAYQK